MLIEIAHAVANAAKEVAEVANETAVREQGVLGSLGINLKLFIAQLVNFAVVLLVLWKWAYKPIVKMMDEREKKIGQSVLNAEKIEKEMAQLEIRKNQVVLEAEKQAQAIISEAKELSEKIRQQQTEKTKVELEKLVVKGKESLETEKVRIVKDAKNEIADLVVLACEKVMGEKMNDKNDKALVEKIINQV